MNIKSPTDMSMADVESGISGGRDLLTDAVETLSDTFEKLDLRSRAETGAADLLDAATTKDGRPKVSALATGAVVIVLAAILIYRQRR